MESSRQDCVPLVNSQSAGDKRVLFLALTVVVIMVVILMCPDFLDVILLVGLLLAIYGAGVHGAQNTAPDRRKEGFNLPGTGAPYAATVPWPPNATGLELAPPSQFPPGQTPEGPVESLSLPGRYPGAIDFDEYDSDPEYGFRDLASDDNANAPQGNPFDLNRVAFTMAAGPCLDDEANDDEIDGDERVTYQARARNDATRVTAGTMNRRKMMEPYLSEEVLEAEEREWWGRHEI
jgi:hypothetical protein